MSRITDALKAAASEVQLSGPLGHLLKLIAFELAALDSLAQAIAASGAGQTIISLLTTLDVLMTERTGSNQTVTAGDTVLLQGTLYAQGDIAYDPATGIYTLVPGKLYELTAALHLINYTSPNGEIQAQWVQADTDTLLNESLIGVYNPTTFSTAQESPSPATRAVYKPADATAARVKLKIVSSSGSADVQAFTSGAIIKQLR